MMMFAHPVEALSLAADYQPHSTRHVLQRGRNASCLSGQVEAWHADVRCLLDKQCRGVERLMFSRRERHFLGIFFQTGMERTETQEITKLPNEPKLEVCSNSDLKSCD